MLEERRYTMPATRNHWWKHVDFILLDTLLIGLVYVVSLSERFGIEQLELIIYQETGLVIVIASLLIPMALPIHKNILRRSIYEEATATAVYVTLVVASVAFYQYFLQIGSFFSRGVFLMTWVIPIPVIIVVNRLGRNVVVRYVEARGKVAQLVLVVDDNRLKESIEHLKGDQENRFHIKAAFVENSSASNGELRKIIDEYDPKIELIRSREEFSQYRVTHAVDEAAISLTDVNRINELTEQLLDSGLSIHINLNQAFGELPNQKLETFGGKLAILAGIRPHTGFQMFIKRAVDILAGIVGLIITGVFILIYGPIIKHQSPGPIFYQQERVGLNGRVFKIYKFRSMYPDADKRLEELKESNKMNGLMFKMDNDPRIIPIGHFMRKYSIDEFPQFLNVLKGDMSAVGTRPPTVGEWKEYDPHHRARLSMKPGITGLWQVSGRSNITDFEEVVRLDVKYIRTWSLINDFKILCKTVKVVLKGEGAE